MKKPKNSGQAESRSALAKIGPEVKAKIGIDPIRRTTVKRVGPGKLQVTISRDLDNMIWDICTPTGTQHEETASRTLQQVSMSLVCPKPDEGDSRLLQAIGTIAGLAPQNPLEAMLATQLIATHEAAMFFMVLATRDEQSFEGRDANVLRATRLMRLHLDQIEAMQKLRGKAGQQKVTVEHVHVHEGGQAIVGAVSSTGAGEVGDGNQNR